MDRFDFLPKRLDDKCIEGNTRNSTSLPNKIGEVILNNVPFCRDKAGNLYFYQDGAYHPNGEFAIQRLYVTWLQQNGAMDDWRDMTPNKIGKWIIADNRCRELWERPPLGTINFLNGLFDWEQNVLLQHSPEYLSTIQIPVEYNPEAVCNTWDRFLKDVLPVNGGDDYLRQIIALCLIPFTGMQKCIVLVGEGSNGKSTFLNGLQKLVGLENVSNIPLHVLTNPLERFSRAGLVGKLVNIFGDLSKRKVEDVANFKALVGEDRLLIEQKHRDAYYYTPFCKLIFSCNEIVSSDDTSAGYLRRFVNIPFIQKFKGDPKVGAELAEQLGSAGELSGLLNKVLPLIPVIISDGLSMSPEVAGVIDDYIVIPDSIREWMESIVVQDDSGMLHSEGFYNYYVECAPADDLPRERAKLVRYIKHLFGVTPSLREIGGKQISVYQGIRTRSKEMGDIWLYPAKDWE